MTRDQVIELTERVLTTTDRAEEWLSRPHPLLNMQTPQALLDTQHGRDRVEQILMGAESGFAV